MPSVKNVDEALRTLGVSGPLGYREFLLKHDGSTSYSFKGRDWLLFGVDVESDCLNILDKKRVDGQKPVYSPFILRQFVATLKSVTGGDSTFDQNQNDFSLDRLASGFAIGDENGDVLFVDSQTQSIYCWYPDGGDVEYLAKSFSEFLRKAKPQKD